MESKALVRSLRHQLVEHLRDDVLSGHYRVGDPIRQEEIVARYNVSRTPVREALLQLEHEGLVELIANCGARVSENKVDSVHEFLMPLRRVIEAFALRKGFDQISEEQYKEWKAILERMREACVAKDYGALSAADIAFHRSIIKLANDQTLLAIWSTIVGRVHEHFISTYSDYEDLMNAYREHVAIVGTFRQGDLEESVRYLSSRIDDPQTVEQLTRTEVRSEIAM